MIKGGRNTKGQIVSSVVCGRRICAVCKHWRPITDFSPRKWFDEEKTQIRYTNTDCYACRRADQQRRYQAATPEWIERRLRSSRAWHRRNRRRNGIKELRARIRISRRSDDSLNREPFAHWLIGEINKYGKGYVATRTRLNKRQITGIIAGYDTSGNAGRTKTGKKRKRKLRAIDWVTVDMVDKALTNYGEPFIFNEIYPIPDEDEDAA